jgi:hypothetical protein
MDSSLERPRSSSEARTEPSRGRRPRCATDAGDVLPHAPVVQGNESALVHGGRLAARRCGNVFVAVHDGDGRDRGGRACFISP